MSTDEPTVLRWGEDAQLTLPDGRCLSFQHRGANGQPALFVLHGAPGSRACLGPEDALVQLQGLRLIAPDRPGLGGSTAQPGRRLLDWAADLDAIAHHLGLSHYWVLGASAGAPHALACGQALPDRVRGVFYLAGPTPRQLKPPLAGMAFGNRLGIFLQTHWPAAARWTYAQTEQAWRRQPEAYVDAVLKSLCPEDRRLLEPAAARQQLIEELDLAFSQGWLGAYDDAALAMGLTRPWGFAPEEVRVPVHAWHGEHDRLVPVACAETLKAAAGPNWQLQRLHDAGHVLVEHPRVLAQLQEVLLG